MKVSHFDKNGNYVTEYVDTKNSKELQKLANKGGSLIIDRNGEIVGFVPSTENKRSLSTTKSKVNSKKKTNSNVNRKWKQNQSKRKTTKGGGAMEGNLGVSLKTSTDIGGNLSILLPHEQAKTLVRVIKGMFKKG